MGNKKYYPKPKHSIRLSSAFLDLCGVEKSQPDKYTFSIDTETSTEEWITTDGVARVWEWGLSGLFVDLKVIGQTVHQLFITLFFLGRCTVYFANAKFDETYLVDYALKNGLDYDGTRCDGALYSARFGDVRILDSLKLLGGSIASQAETWNLPIAKIEEPEEFYNKYRDLGHVPDAEEVRYLWGDVDVQARALKEAFRYGLGVGGITKAGTAFSMLKKYLKLRGFSFHRLFPIIANDELERACYGGGWVLAGKKYAGKTVNNVRCFDINAMYAAAYSGNLPSYPGCRFMDEFPVGYCLLKTEDAGLIRKVMTENRFYYFLRISIRWAILKPGRLPTIQFRKRYTMRGRSDYDARVYRHTFENVDIFLDKKEFHNVFLQDYDADFEIAEIRAYEIGSFHEVFDEWAQTWSREKAAANKYKEDGTPNPDYNPGLRQIAKDMLTNPYGKFGMRPVKIIDTPRIADGKIVYGHAPDPKSAAIYVGFSCAVTSAAKSFITRVAQDNAQKFAYADTDSVKLVDAELSPEIVNATALGYFKDEGTYTRAKFLRAKTYMYEDADGVQYTCCGLPKAGKDMLKEYPPDVQFRRFKEGLTVPSCKLRPKTYPGGCVLVKTDFTINQYGV